MGADMNFYGRSVSLVMWVDIVWSPKGDKAYLVRSFRAGDTKEEDEHSVVDVLLDRQAHGGKYADLKASGLSFMVSQRSFDDMFSTYMQPREPVDAQKLKDRELYEHLKRKHGWD